MRFDKFWAMKNINDPDMGFFTGTFLTRKDGIEEAEWNYNTKWKNLYRQGYRMVKVKVEGI